MLRGLKDKSLQKALDKALSERQVYNRQVKLKTLGVLIDARQNVDVMSVMRLADHLGVKAMDLDVLGLKEPKDTAKQQASNNTNYFDEKMISSSGNFKSQSVESFADKSFDVLISFYGEDHKELDLVAAKSKAKFKVGFATVDNRINDLVIGVDPNNSDKYISELKKYLKILEII